jgi:hypothetical protein
VTYYNCGDWVESCSALVESEDGIISLLNYEPFPVAARLAQPPSGAVTADVAGTSRAFDNS